ncbi:MAG: DUF3870 domain-containing protein [Chloroflexi bacterium]|nr:DUF3870 domain-containing protein [Chloroflexota bacterium]
MTARMHNTVFFAGYARLPESVTGRDGEQVLGLELEVDPDTDLIVDLSCTAVLPLGAKFIKDLLVGHNLQETMDGPKKEIEWHYFSATQKAILAALDNVYERWQRYKKGIQEIERAKL